MYTNEKGRVRTAWLAIIGCLVLMGCPLAAPPIERYVAAHFDTSTKETYAARCGVHNGTESSQFYTAVYYWLTQPVSSCEEARKKAFAHLMVEVGSQRYERGADKKLHPNPWAFLKDNQNRQGYYHSLDGKQRPSFQNPKRVVCAFEKVRVLRVTAGNAPELLLKSVACDREAFWAD